MRFAALVVAGSMVATGGWAADRACTPADTARAQKAIDRVLTWSQLQKARQDFAHCDSGDVSDAYTDALLRLLVDWQDVPTLSKAMGDPEFKQFVLAHLRAATKDDRDAVYSRAKASCPAGADAVCAQLADTARAK